MGLWVERAYSYGVQRLWTPIPQVTDPPSPQLWKNSDHPAPQWPGLPPPLHLGQPRAA